METARISRSRGRAVLAVIFTLFALSAWWQVVQDLAGGNDSPRLLTLLQAVIGAIAVATAWGSWIGARWAPLFALLYGVITGGMVASLGPILDLPAASRNGLWSGGAIIFLFGLWSAWWLRRSLRRDRERETSHIVGFD
jgi:putative Ca2+/H+ antiporter (TMEM165/GDT1 family)